MAKALVTPERAAVLRERLKEKFAELRAAQEIIERIAAGAPRSSFGEFALLFEEIAGLGAIGGRGESRNQSSSCSGANSGLTRS